MKLPCSRHIGRATSFVGENRRNTTLKKMVLVYWYLISRDHFR